MGLILRELEIRDEHEALAAHREFPDWEFLLSYNSDMEWSDYVARCNDIQLGINMPKGVVPATFFLAEVDGEVIGRSSIRHQLNTFLLNYGGHIGYGVRPKFRRRGYATEILRQSLSYIRKIGVEDILVTCFAEYIGSATVIERCGGELENTVELDGKPLRRYWIRMATSDAGGKHV